MASFTVSLVSAGYMFVVFMVAKVRMSHYSRITRSVLRMPFMDANSCLLNL